MQKIMACLERPAQLDSADWYQGINQHLVAYAGDFLACHFALEDHHVEEARNLRLENSSHPKNALVTIWVKNACSLDDFFADLETLGQHQAYAVIETRSKPFKQEVGRTPGFCQTCFLTTPSSQSRQHWLNLWLGQSTEVSIRTQSSYSLTQNITSVPLPVGMKQPGPWLRVDGIVEDYFPREAMNSREAFYAAIGDTQKYLKNERELISSCLKFINFDNFDCIPMSQYVVKACDW